MSTTPSRLRTVYWGLQITGWGAWCVLGLAMSRVQQGRFDPAAVIGYALFFAYSIGLTHLLGRMIERRGWLTLDPLPALARLATAVAVTAAVQAAFVLIVSALLHGGRPETPLWQSALFFWINFLFGTGVWTALYITITTWIRSRRARLEAAALENSLNRARLQSLEAQLSPHFLFNCLNSLRGLIAENPVLAQDMVTRLANILRHNLVHDAASTEPLGEQVAVVSDYLALEAMRFDERLRAKFDVDPATTSCAVPAMLLQTLVENAIKHGIAHLLEGGDVVVRTRLESGTLVIAVENTGTLDGPGVPHSTGVGLANLRERLQLLFGPAATLELAAVAAHRVCATVRLAGHPARPSPTP